MSKKRIIACLVMKDGWIVQSLGFHRYLPVGRPEIAARFLDDWGVDELVLSDISATPNNTTIDSDVVRRVALSCHVPLTVGGGIRSVDDVRALLQAGADKVCINTAATGNADLLNQAAATFGDQCVIASIDAKKLPDGSYEVFTNGGRSPTGIDPVALAVRFAEAGAGEILLNSIDNDGRRCGYDMALIDAVATAVSIPVIALGGAGNAEHLREALARDHVSAAAAANFWHYTEHSVSIVKAHLLRGRIDVRNDCLADYANSPLSKEDGRLDKRADAELEEMVFEYIPEEVI